MTQVGTVFGRPDPTVMMQSMSNFISDVVGYMDTLVTKMVDQAKRFSPKALKGAEAIAKIIAAVAQLGAALLEPLASMSENAGGFMGSGKGENMAAMVESVAGGVGTILDSLSSKLPALVEGMIGVFDSPNLKKIKLETIKMRAETLKFLFDGILSMVTAVEKLQAFEQEDTSYFWQESNAKSAVDVLDGMFTTVSDALGLPSIGTMIDNAIKLGEKITCLLYTSPSPRD